MDRLYFYMDMFKMKNRSVEADLREKVCEKIFRISLQILRLTVIIECERY